VVTQTLSRDLGKYSVLTPLALAARQLETQGKAVKRGQQVRFIYMARTPGVHAWDLPSELDPRAINVFQYRELACRAVYEVLQPLGIKEGVLRDWLLNRASYVLPTDLVDPTSRSRKQEAPIFSDLPYLHLDVV
jgi:DNA polymerase elongation subunit (family B)